MKSTVTSFTLVFLSLLVMLLLVVTPAGKSSTVVITTFTHNWVVI